MRSLADYSGPLFGGVALWLFTVTGHPALLRWLRTTSETFEPEVIA